MTEPEIRPLDPSTWDAFAAVVAKHNGTRAVYERAGFDFIRTKGKGDTVMRSIVSPRSSSSG
jgi:hypothetical protein